MIVDNIIFNDVLYDYQCILVTCLSPFPPFLHNESKPQLNILLLRINDLKIIIKIHLLNIEVDMSLV